MPTPCRVKTQNAHHCNHALHPQEDAWGATYQYKDGWQEDSVRDVTSEVKDRARRLPEALYASWQSTKHAVHFWTSPLRGDSERCVVHPTVHRSNTPRQFVSVDDWGPMDDSRGRCLQTWKSPIEDIDDRGATVSDRLASVQPGAMPTILQCQAILMHFFRMHDLDPELVEWEDIWKAERDYHAYQSDNPRRRRRVVFQGIEEVLDCVDYTNVMF